MFKIIRGFIRNKRNLFILTIFFFLTIYISLARNIFINAENSTEPEITLSNELISLNEEQTFNIGNKKGSLFAIPEVTTTNNEFSSGEYTGVSSGDNGILIMKVNINNGIINRILFISIPRNISSEILTNYAKKIIKNQILAVSDSNVYYNITQYFNDALKDALAKARES